MLKNLSPVARDLVLEQYFSFRNFSSFALSHNNKTLAFLKSQGHMLNSKASYLISAISILRQKSDKMQIWTRDDATTIRKRKLTST